MAGAAGLNAAEIATITWHIAFQPTCEEARRSALLIPCSALNGSLFGSAELPVFRAGKFP
jgi:hypothetical protein